MRGSPGRNILKWTPRILSGLTVFTFALLATDAFHQSGNKIIQFGDFLSYLLPALLTLGASFAALYRPLTGGAVLLLLALTYELTAGGRVPLSAHLIVTAPLSLCGLLFALSGWVEKRVRKGR